MNNYEQKRWKCGYKFVDRDRSFCFCDRFALIGRELRKFGFYIFGFKLKMARDSL